MRDGGRHSISPTSRSTSAWPPPHPTRTPAVHPLLDSSRCTRTKGAGCGALSTLKGQVAGWLLSCLPWKGPTHPSFGLISERMGAKSRPLLSQRGGKGRTGLHQTSVWPVGHQVQARHGPAVALTVGIRPTWPQLQGLQVTLP